MKGKYNLFVSAFLAFFASVLVVNAKDLTLTQLGEAIKEADPDATEAFVIGTHVFTDTHLLTTQDVMIAARTINVGDINEKGYGFNESKPEADPLYKLMAINVIEMSGNTWKVGSPVIAGPALADKINVEYINYKYVSVKVNTDEIVKAEVEKINETAKNAILTMSNDVVTVKTKASLNTTVASTIAEDLLNLMKSETYAGKFASIKLATVDSTGKVSTTDVLEIKTNTTKSEISSKLSTYISGNSNFVVEFTMAEGIANTGNYETYTVKFVTLVDIMR